jgi:hypothetical protein
LFGFEGGHFWAVLHGCVIKRRHTGNLLLDGGLALMQQCGRVMPGLVQPSCQA